MLSGVVVSTLACHASDPGSIPASVRHLEILKDFWLPNVDHVYGESYRTHVKDPLCTTFGRVGQLWPVIESPLPHQIEKHTQIPGAALRRRAT